MNLITDLQTSLLFGITFFVFVGQRDIDVLDLGARPRIGLRRGDICIVGSVVL